LTPVEVIDRKALRGTAMANIWNYKKRSCWTFESCLATLGLIGLFFSS